MDIDYPLVGLQALADKAKKKRWESEEAFYLGLIDLLKRNEQAINEQAAMLKRLRELADEWVDTFNAQSLSEIMDILRR